MTPSQAADILNCTPRAVRLRIERGDIRATKVPLPSGGFCYDISTREVTRAKNNPPRRGRPANR